MLIAGRVTNPDAKAYRLYDWTPPGRYEYTLESVGINGEIDAFTTTTDGGGPVTVDPAGLSSPLSPHAIEAALFGAELAQHAARAAELTARFSALADNLSTLKPRNIATKVGQTFLSAGSGRQESLPHDDPTARAIDSAAGIRWFSAAPLNTTGSYSAAKVIYDAPGVLRVPQSMLPPGFDVRRMAIQREGRGVTALAVTADGSLLLYGPGYRDDYTDKDAFFLRATSAPTPAGTATAATHLFDAGVSVNANSPATASVDFHDVYFDYNFRPYTFAPWFSSQYLTQGTAQSFSLATPNASAGAATLTVNLWSLTQTDGVAFDHALQVAINGVPAGQAQWSGGGQMLQLTFVVPSGTLISGANTIELITPALDGVENQTAFLHSLSMNYTQFLDGSQPLNVINSSAAAQVFEVSHLPGTDAWVVDARYPDRAALVPTETQPQADGTYTLRFIAGAGAGLFLVVPEGMENAPVSVSARRIQPARLRGTYLTTGPAQFGPGVQPLLAQRAKEGIRGAFVDQEQLFDYYNDGRYGPSGIQNAVRALHPRYVLLLGRTTYDYLNYSGLNVDPLCPAFLVSTTFWSQATSDSMFGDLGRGYPEAAVGRLPVNDATELATAVSRILNYKGVTASSVRVHAAADRADPAVADFAAQSDSLAQLNPGFSWQRNYLGDTYQTSPEVTAALANAANGGADWLIYIGHGNSVRLGNEVPRILNNDEVQAWSGNVVFLQSTCTANWMAADQVGFQSIAMQALSQPQGGISASIGSSTYVTVDASVQFMGQLLKSANAPGMRWGDALLHAQQWSFQTGAGSYVDLGNTEQLFGDPALPVFAPALPSTSAAHAAPGSF